MLDFTLTKSAQKRMKERHISIEQIDSALKNPDKESVNSKDQKILLVRKLYFNEYFDEKRLLLVIYKKNNSEIVVLTVIDLADIESYF